MAQGGGGIFGDFIFDDADRYRCGFVETLAGPTAGTIGSLVELWQRVRDGDDVAARAFKAAFDNAPVLNLRCVLPLLEYAVRYQVADSLKPGFHHAPRGRAALARVGVLGQAERGGAVGQIWLDKVVANP